MSARHLAGGRLPRETVLGSLGVASAVLALAFLGLFHALLGRDEGLRSGVARTLSLAPLWVHVVASAGCAVLWMRSRGPGKYAYEAYDVRVLVSAGVGALLLLAPPRWSTGALLVLWLVRVGMDVWSGVDLLREPDATDELRRNVGTVVVGGYVASAALLVVCIALRPPGHLGP